MTSVDSSYAGPLRTFEWDDADAPSHAVITAVAEQLDADPMEIDPIYSVVDPDALDTLFGPDDGEPSPVGSVEFEHLGYRVVVEAGGRGYLYETE